MNFKSLAGAIRLAVSINERLGENLIPTDQKWEVFDVKPMDLKDVRMQMSDSLSGYSTTRFTFGAIKDSELGTSTRSASFTLVPLYDTLDLGKNPKVRQFHFSAVRDTLSVSDESQLRILQNVFVSELKKPLDSTVLYTGSFMDAAKRAEFLDTDNIITAGIPVYDGGDTLSFDFSKDFAQDFLKRLDAYQQTAALDSMDLFVEKFPGIYITTDAPSGNGGRINMMDISIDDSQGYIAGNYAELKITSTYGDRLVDTAFVFFFGPAEFLKDDDTSYPTQFAFNASSHESYDIYRKGITATDRIYVEGGSGIKPVVKASEIKGLVEEQLAAIDADTTLTDEEKVAKKEEVTASPAEATEVKIPRGSDEVFDRYNELQKSQGYDLSKYAGKKVMRYVYQVNNFPDAKEPVYATLLVYKDLIIGGDITDTTPGGKVQGFCQD